jgi:glycosyltransferase involved in cell wall biosynthesis
MGYAYVERIPYLVDLSENKTEQQRLADEADVVIINSGSADPMIVEKRIFQNKVTFFCNERLFKKGFVKYADPRLWKQWGINLLARGKRTYLLSIGKYSSQDFEQIGFEKGKSFKFGYFPQIVQGEQYQQSDTIHMVWVGRMIDWKQPEIMIDIASILEKQNLSYVLDMVGDGPLREKVEICRSRLSHPENVVLHNMLPNEMVRQLMSHADALVMTSNRQEGWGAVANEALSVGTPVVAFETVGAADYLIRSGINGQLYKENNPLQMVEGIIQIKNNSNMYRSNALQTIDSWNAVVAAERFFQIALAIYQSKDSPQFDSGPLSLIKE